MKHLSDKVVFSVLLFFVILLSFEAKAQNEAEKNKYAPTWESLKNYEAPEWYEDAKLGFWVHWGVYSVPAFKGGHAAEWYGRWMYCQEGQSSRNNQGLATHLHHHETYGPPNEFGYKDLIPMFKAENFNPDEWADLCIRGGAKFFTMMATHHDAFCMWDTKLSKWNSVNMGPKRDLVGEMEKAARDKGLKFGVSNHSAWNPIFFQWNHINRYDAVDTTYQDLYGNPIIPKSMDTIRIGENESRSSFLTRTRWGTVQPGERDLNRWIARTIELADLYHPDLYYFDWGFRFPVFEPYRKEFGAHYYNKAIEWGNGEFGKPNVVLNYKQSAYAPGSAVKDFERGGMDSIADMVWQTDNCVYDDHNWGFVEGAPIKPTDMIIDQFMDIISKKGVLMLSFAPRADGTFPEEQKTMMYELGDWLSICGEAVYSTRPYEIFGEVGNKWGQRNEAGYKTYVSTSEDIRFTRNKENTILYAISLKWPANNRLIIKSMHDANLSDLKSIKLIGSNKKLKYKQTSKGLEISLPDKPDYKFAYPIKLVFKNKIASVNN